MAIAILPLVGLVAYSAADRYDADRKRATARAVTRAELYATLLSEEPPGRPSGLDMARLDRVSAIGENSAIEVYDRGGRAVASAGDSGAFLPADDPRIQAALRQTFRPGGGSQTFDARGPDGISRIWGFAQVNGKPLTVAYSLPGDSVYGPAQGAFRRDLAFAAGAGLLALVAALLLAGHATAPIRRLAARMGEPGTDDIGTIERGVDRMGETIEESKVELARRAERLQLVLDQRNRANQELVRLNAELEQRVAVRTEQLEAANRELEAFSYSVSHDLRAPLRAIDGFSRILVDDHSDGLSVEALRYLGLVRKNTLQMGELIDGLLAFARLGQQPVDKRLVDVEVLAQDLVASELAHRNGRTLEFEVEPLPPVRADPTLLRQVYANLLSNAVKYTGAVDPARIELGSFPDGDRAVYFVRDNGVGFDMRYSDKLFQVFQRLHSDGYEGTGVGLALTARIVERHGGAIWAEAAPGEGATFYFTLEGGALERPDG